MHARIFSSRTCKIPLVEGVLNYVFIGETQNLEGIGDNLKYGRDVSHPTPY